MATDDPRAAADACEACVHIGRWNGHAFMQVAPIIDAGHSPLAHRLYRICANGGITTRAQPAALTDGEFLDLRNAGVSTLALLRQHIPAPIAGLDTIRAALADLEAAGLRDLRPGSAAVALRCEAMRRFGLPAAQSLLLLQRIRHDYGPRLAANLGAAAVDELTDSLIRSIAAVAAPDGA